MKGRQKVAQGKQPTGASPWVSAYEIREWAVRAVMEEGLALTAVAQAYGVERSTVHRWLSRFQVSGEAGLARLPGSGRTRSLGELDAEALTKIVLSPAAGFGYETDLWTTRRLIQVIHSRFKALISKRTIMRRLREVGLTYQKSEREYFELSQEQRAE